MGGGRGGGAKFPGVWACTSESLASEPLRQASSLPVLCSESCLLLVAVEAAGDWKVGGDMRPTLGGWWTGFLAPRAAVTMGLPVCTVKASFRSSWEPLAVCLSL